MEWKDETFSKCFAESFNSLTDSDFTRAIGSDRRLSRNLLRKRDVYFKKGREIQISDSLHHLVNEHTSWPPDEDTSEFYFSSFPDNPGLKLETKNASRDTTQEPTGNGSPTKEKGNMYPGYKLNVGNLSNSYQSDS